MIVMLFPTQITVLYILLYADDINGNKLPRIGHHVHTVRYFMGYGRAWIRMPLEQYIRAPTYLTSPARYATLPYCNMKSTSTRPNVLEYLILLARFSRSASFLAVCTLFHWVFHVIRQKCDS